MVRPVILNLRDLNANVESIHFKLDTIKDALQLMYQNWFFASVYFKHAYFSVPVEPSHRKWLRFVWQDVLFQFTCMPQGYTAAPRIFTKLLKPVLAHLRMLGITVICYIDDCLFISDSVSTLIANLNYAIHLFDNLGLTINLGKLVLEPTHSIEFLGFVIDSRELTVQLTAKRQKRIQQLGRRLLTAECYCKGFCCLYWHLSGCCARSVFWLLTN